MRASLVTSTLYIVKRSLPFSLQGLRVMGGGGHKVVGEGD